MYVDLVVPQWGKCSADQLLANLGPATDPAVARIDLSRSTWCEPAGLVAVAAFAEAQRDLGRAVEFIAPRDPNQANYLGRMHLGLVLDELGCEHNIRPVRESRDVELLELQRFEGEDGAAELAAMVYDKTAAMPPVAAALHRSIGEIGGNVSQHSGKPVGYVAAASTYRRRRIEFAVADAGWGLTHNLTRLGVSSDEDSLRVVLDIGMTSTRDPGRGRGIRETRHLVTALAGKVHMITGGAARVAERDSSSGWNGRQPFPGTVLQGSLWCP